MCMYGTNHIHFQDGTTMKKASEVTYLGGSLTKDVQPKVEIQNRIRMVMQAVRSLEGLWKHTSCSVKWKVNVYNAVVVSKLLYGLETVQMPPSVMKDLDVFQMRGFRKILGIQPTYMDRSNSNEEVFRKLREDHNLPHILPLTVLLQKRRVTLLGHIIRAGNRNSNDPAFQATFDSNAFQPKHSIEKTGTY